MTLLKTMSKDLIDIARGVIDLMTFELNIVLIDLILLTLCFKSVADVVKMF